MIPMHRLRNLFPGWLLRCAGLFLALAPGALPADPLDEAGWRTFHIATIGAWDQPWGSITNSLQTYRSRMLSMVGGVQPRNVKVGWYGGVGAHEHTLGAYFDYLYTPYYFSVDLNYWLGLAIAYDLPVGFSVSGPPWADSDNQSLDILSNYLEKSGGGCAGEVKTGAREQAIGNRD